MLYLRQRYILKLSSVLYTSSRMCVDLSLACYLGNTAFLGYPVTNITYKRLCGATRATAIPRVRSLPENICLVCPETHYPLGIASATPILKEVLSVFWSESVKLLK